MATKSKNTKALPHVSSESLTPAQARLASLTAEPEPKETGEQGAEKPETEPAPTEENTPEAVAEMAMAQATAEPVTVALWLPAAGSFSPAIVSKRLRDAESIIGRMRVPVDGNLTKLSGSAGKGGVFWEGHCIRPAQSEKEKAAFALAKAGRAFAKALKDFGHVE